MERYFVARFSENLIEVQRLDEEGRALCSAKVNRDTGELLLGEQPVPEGVLRAAIRQTDLFGQYVDASGEPFDLFAPSPRSLRTRLGGAASVRAILRRARHQGGPIRHQGQEYTVAQLEAALQEPDAA